MDDFWGVVWGASIALVASVTGGALTAVVGPWLARTADERSRRDERALVAAEEKRRVVRESIHVISEGLRKRAEALSLDSPNVVQKQRLEVRAELIRLRLWTSEDERQVAETVVDALATNDVFDAVAAFGAWDRCAVAWFRGALAGADFEDAFDADIEDHAEETATYRRQGLAKRQAAKKSYPEPEPF